MANIKSAMKRVDITAKQNLRNRVIMSSMKTAMKKLDKAIAENDQALVSETYLKAVSLVDKAALKGVIHKNNANRKKAQLAKKLSAAN